MTEQEIENLFKDEKVLTASDTILNKALTVLSNRTSVDNHWIVRALVINTIKSQRHIDRIERRNQIYTWIIIILTIFSIFVSIVSLVKDVNASGGSSDKPYIESNEASANNEIITTQYQTSSDNAEAPTLISDRIFLAPKHDIFWTLVSSILGGIIGLGLVSLTDWLKTPILFIQKGSEAPAPPNHPLGNWKIIHIRVRNRKRKYKYLPIRTSTAFSTAAQIVITDNSNKKSFSGKWGSTLQPILSGQVQPDLTYLPPKADIHPSSGIDEEYEEVAVGMKYDGEDEFYGFNLQSYLYQNNKLKNPDLQFGKGEYVGKIVLSSQGIRYPLRFKVYNKSSSLNDFYLEV